MPPIFSPSITVQGKTFTQDPIHSSLMEIKFALTDDRKDKYVIYENLIGFVAVKI